MLTLRKHLILALVFSISSYLNIYARFSDSPIPQTLADSSVVLDSLFNDVKTLLTTDPAACLQQCSTAISLAEHTSNDSIKTELMLIAAKANYLKGKYQKALEILLDLEEINRSQKDDILHAKILLHKGNIHWFRKSYNEALIYYKEAKQIGISHNNNEIKGWALNNIGLIYEFLKYNDSALSYMLQAQEIRIKEKDTAHIYTGYYNIGAVYQSMGQYETANKYMTKAIEQDGRFIPAIEYGHYLIYIGYGYMKREEYKNAEYYLLKGIEKCEELNAIYSLEEGYRYLAVVYEAQSKFANAFEYAKQSSILKDSLYSKQMSEEITKLKLNYESEKKEKEIQLLRLEKELNIKEAKRKGFKSKIYLAISILLSIILVLVYRQIIAQKSFNSKLQKQVSIKTSELKAATDKAIRANNLKTEFLKNMSHEVRTPLNAIHGFSSLLSEIVPYDEEAYAHLKIISTNTDILLDIFTNMLELSQLENGEVIIEKTEVNLCDFLQSITYKYNAIAQELSKNKVSLMYVNPPIEQLEKYSTTVKTDPKYLQQAFVKLVDNAIKFTENGEIKTGIKLTEKTVTLFIEDSGIGILQEQVDEIFDKFTKLENNKNKLYGGPGLGLTICKLTTEKLNGKVWVESEIGKGSTFYIELPCSG